MPQTISVIGSDEVMALFGKPGYFLRGKHQKIWITKASEDKDIPISIRTALVGLIVPCIFTKKRLEEQGILMEMVPDGSIFAYAEEVIKTLLSAGKTEEGMELKKIADNELDMYTFEAGTFKMIL